jgi:hypothetical protein
MKLYFASVNDEICYPLSYFKMLMEYEGYEEMELIEAEKSKIPDGYFWCKSYECICEKDDYLCGKICKGYEPRNGKSGCCKHYSLVGYDHTEKILKLKL